MQKQQLLFPFIVTIFLAHQPMQPMMQNQEPKNGAWSWLAESVKKNPYVVAGLGMSLVLYKVRYYIQALLCDKQEQLGEAVKENNIEKLHAVVAMGGDVNKPIDKWGVTALIQAAMRGRTEMVRALLKLGASIDTQEPIMDWTALMFAADRNDLKNAQFLLEAGANVHITSSAPSARNAVDRAIARGAVETVSLLLKAEGRLDISWMNRMDLRFAENKKLLEIMIQYKNAAIQYASANIKTDLYEHPIDMPKDLCNLVVEYVVGDKSNHIADTELLHQYALENRKQFMRKISDNTLKNKKNTDGLSQANLKISIPFAIITLGMVGLAYKGLTSYSA